MVEDEKILFFIVGIGKENSERYLDILKKSVEESLADRVILLTSSKSKEKAEAIEKYWNDSHYIQIVTIKNGTEFDVDECFEFFEEQIKKVLNNGITPNNLVIDFTHGTKPMSAALYALGMRYHIYNFQYVVRQQDVDGNFTGEEVKYFDAAYVKYLDLIEQCGSLFENWQFEAVETLISSQYSFSGAPKTKLVKNAVDYLKYLADFYSAWDRMDYKNALDKYPYFRFGKMNKFLPVQQVENMLKILVAGLKEPLKKYEQWQNLSEDDGRNNKKFLFCLMFDLYANALRRISEGKLEDASIRVYKMAETLGQIYLLDLNRNYIAGCMPMHDAKVKEYALNNNLKLEYKTIDMDRGKVKKFLKVSGYNKEKVEFLEKIGNEIRNLRNNSILIHGYSVRATDKEQLKELLDKIIDRLISEDCGCDFEEMKNTALFINKFKECK